MFERIELILYLLTALTVAFTFTGLTKTIWFVKECAWQGASFITIISTSAKRARSSRHAQQRLAR